MWLAARGVDVQIHERAWSHALRFGEGHQVGHANIENEDAGLVRAVREPSFPPVWTRGK